MHLKKSWDLNLIHKGQQMLMRFGLELVYGSQKGCNRTQKAILIYPLHFGLFFFFFFLCKHTYVRGKAYDDAF